MHHVKELPFDFLGMWARMKFEKKVGDRSLPKKKVRIKKN